MLNVGDILVIIFLFIYLPGAIFLVAILYQRSEARRKASLRTAGVRRDLIAALDAGLRHTRDIWRELADALDDDPAPAGTSNPDMAKAKDEKEN